MDKARNAKKRITVGTARAVRGRRTTGRLALGSYPDGAIDSPVIIATGAKAGPTLWIQGCVHGPEVGGPVAMLRFLDGLDLKKVSGTIVAVMTANPTATVTMTILMSTKEHRRSVTASTTTAMTAPPSTTMSTATAWPGVMATATTRMPRPTLAPGRSVTAPTTTAMATWTSSRSAGSAAPLVTTWSAR